VSDESDVDMLVRIRGDDSGGVTASGGPSAAVGLRHPDAAKATTQRRLGVGLSFSNSAAAAGHVASTGANGDGADRNAPKRRRLDAPPPPSAAAGWHEDAPPASDDLTGTAEAVDDSLEAVVRPPPAAGQRSGPPPVLVPDGSGGMTVQRAAAAPLPGAGGGASGADLDESTDSLLNAAPSSTRPLSAHLHLHTAAGRALADAVTLPVPSRGAAAAARRGGGGAGAGGGVHVVTLVPEAPKRKARTRVRWSEEEEAALRDGHRELGSAWSAILSRGRGVFAPHRTATDLKDKWRNLQREDE
jgi:hypothetical protein